MKIRLLFITLFLVVGLMIIFTIPLSKNDKWTINLVNDYVIKKENSDKIQLGILKDNKFYTKLDGMTVGITDYIAEFSYGKNYILLKCLDNEDDLTIKFYLVNSKDRKIYGPYLDYEEFNNKVLEMVDEELGDFIKTIDYGKEMKS